MKYGVREICDVVFKAKKNMTIGNKKFFKDEPVIYFDSLKTSTLEGAASTVYAQGGKGNPRLVAWEGDRTVTFTMEDALISPAGIMILSGAGLVEATENKPIYVHTTEQTDKVKCNKTTVKDDEGQDVEKLTSVEITLSQTPADDHKGCSIYVMLLDDEGEMVTEPYTLGITVSDNKITIPADKNDLSKFDKDNCVVFVDFYVKKTGSAKQIEIEAGKFGGNFYVESSTLFRNADGIDYPAEFVIPNAKVQSNFSFAMAASGDPSTFTFTMDAFPDYTRFDNTKKVLAIVQIIEEADEGDNSVRVATAYDYEG